MLTLQNKKLILRIIVVIAIFTVIVSNNVKAVVNPKQEFYVNDYANILSSETEKYIIEKNIILEKKSGVQIVVVTVPSLEGNSLEEYATTLFRSFGIGDKNKNNGILMLLALEEREFRIEVGYGLEGVLPDAKTGRIQDEYIIPYLKNNNWNDGIKNGFNAILSEVTKEYNLNMDVDEIVKFDDKNTEYSAYFVCFCFSVIAGYIIRAISKIISKNNGIICMCICVLIYVIIAMIIGYLITSSIISLVFNFIIALRRQFIWLYIISFRN